MFVTQDVGVGSRARVLVPSSTLLASVDVIPSLEASLLATIRWSRSLLVLCLPVLQLPPHFGLPTSGVGVATVVSFFAATIWSLVDTIAFFLQRLPGRLRMDGELSTAATWLLVDGCCC
jgi:hypothetical protein